MAQVTYPGVYIQEVPSGVHTITTVGTSITAFIDFFREGPMNEAVEVFGMADFQRIFGGLDDRSEAQLRDRAILPERRQLGVCHPRRVGSALRSARRDGHAARQGERRHQVDDRRRHAAHHGERRQRRHLGQQRSRRHRSQHDRPDEVVQPRRSLGTTRRPSPSRSRANGISTFRSTRRARRTSSR